MDTKLLRENFKIYLSKRYPQDNNVSATVSMAYFLDRYGNEFGLSFEQILSDGVIPDVYEYKLEESFVKRGRKNPRSDASTYAHSLRLLLEFVKGQPNEPAVKGQKATVKSSSNTQNSKDIASPTAIAVESYLDRWNTLPGYKEQEDALDLLFLETYPDNTDLSKVLIKCSVLNDFYKTNIYGVMPVAKRIISLDTDWRLKSGDPKMVNDIASGHGIKSRTGKELQLLSFATKYCSRHNSADYPIYDYYVERLLAYFRDKDRFSSFSGEDLRDYQVFKQAILTFREAYSLQKYTVKQIDQYLWQAGKEAFPIKY
ncbi:hypothetical protein ACH6CV_04115 [Bacillota bacterium Meth-B3]